MRFAFLAILFSPWSCKCLLANIVNSRFPGTSSPFASSLKPTFLYSIEVPSLESKESDEWSGHRREGNTLRQDNITGTNQGLQVQWQRQEKRQIYLFSLNWIQESDSEYFLKKDVRRLWEWKDTTLGDGRDFFVPKPKTLMALQQYLLENIPNLVECSIISNCARLEVLCSYSYSPAFQEVEREGEERIEKQQNELLARDISECFITQLDHHRIASEKSNTWTKIVMQLPVNVDRPEYVLTRKPPSVDPMKPVSQYDSWWNVTEGPRAILTHVCKVSAGMGRRPRRPDRPVIFRPFSSRDTHILLQLKRTRENIGFLPVGDDEVSKEFRGTSTKSIDEGKNEGENSPSKQHRKRKLLPIVLDYALRAGKAARNSNIVPEILELKEMTSAESSVGTASEQQTSERVANAAYEKGIKPLILEGVTKLDDSTNNIDQRIAEFRRNAFVFLNEIEPQFDNNERKAPQHDLRSWLNRRLHEPTTKLRLLARHQNGDNTKDVEVYLCNSLQEIQNEIQNENRRLRNLNRLEN